MALTESTMLELGSKTPDFSLLGTDEHQHSLSDFKQPLLVVLFICNHCPYVVHIAPALAKLAARYQALGVDFVAINSNDINAYPADNFDNMCLEHSQRDYSFPYLLDDTQAIAKAFGAACTPDIFVFDEARHLIYRGEFDNTRPHRISSGNYDSGQRPATGASLAQALDIALAGDSIPTKQYPSLGCNIKWQPGNEPEYFR